MINKIKNLSVTTNKMIVLIVALICGTYVFTHEIGSQTVSRVYSQYMSDNNITDEEIYKSIEELSVFFDSMTEHIIKGDLFLSDYYAHECHLLEEERTDSVYAEEKFQDWCVNGNRVEVPVF